MHVNLASFQKPSRYIGNEVNSIQKDADVKVALCFPDTYEIGMSHIGLKILYMIINGMPYALAERVFAPWVDYEDFLRRNRLLLTSLESGRPLKDFDIVGFSLQYELSYTNVLNMLDLGGIPVRSEDRTDAHPLVIAGGPCATNPVPLSPFIDAFVIGDGENVIKEIIELYRAVNPRPSNKGTRNRHALLKGLSCLEGVYVPLIHDHTAKIKKRVVRDLDVAPFPDSPVVPFTSIVHDRVAIEVSRGCAMGCRFCQAGMIYRPLRERSPENVLRLAHNSIMKTGYDEISFTSLNTGDYSNLLPLIKAFNRRHPYVSISLPSMRVNSINSEVLREIRSVRKTGFTIAPEAGTERLRSVINKDFTEEEYEEAVRRLFTEGWKNIKFYFMIGLPTETHEDIERIVDMVETALRTGRKLTGGSVNINVGVSAFVPKPHTPFQWLGQAPFDELRSRQEFLRKALHKKGANLKFQQTEVSLLEAVFSKGGEETSLLLETAWRAGCRFDGWSETFSFDSWLRAAERTGLDLYRYASRELHHDMALPWDIVDCGITKEFLLRELRRAFSGERSPDCREVCHRCGLNCNGVDKGNGGVSLSAGQGLQLSAVHIASGRALRVRVRFSKTGLMRYLSHLEVMTAILRAMRRAGVPMLYTKGFHPHPKVSFGPALPVGVEGLNEYFDIELAPSVDIAALPARVNRTLPEGLRIEDAAIITRDMRSLSDTFCRYEYEIIIPDGTQQSVRSFLSSPHYHVSRDGKTVDIRPLVESVTLHDRTLRVILADREGVKVRVHEVLKEMLGVSQEETLRLSIKRVRLYGPEGPALPDRRTKGICRAR